jgi:hypothetical protein
MLIDFNHNSGARYEIRPSLSAAVNAHIDEALLARHRLQAPRDYLGASRIGEPCARRLAYEYAHTPEDPDKAFSGQTLRIFAAGHTFEDLTIEWLRAAGFFSARASSEDGQPVGPLLEADGTRGRLRFYKGHFEDHLAFDPHRHDRDWRIKRQLSEATFGWAITCHKAQGSQWENVIVWDDGLGQGEADRRRWLYTAITRAERGLVILA